MSLGPVAPPRSELLRSTIYFQHQTPSRLHSARTTKHYSPDYPDLENENFPASRTRPGRMTETAAPPPPPPSPKPRQAAAPPPECPADASAIPTAIPHAPHSAVSESAPVHPIPAPAPSAATPARCSGRKSSAPPATPTPIFPPASSPPPPSPALCPTPCPSPASASESSDPRSSPAFEDCPPRWQSPPETPVCRFNRSPLPPTS